MFLQKCIWAIKKTNKIKVEEFIRVDHAGERGAVKIYEGQLLALNTIVKDDDLIIALSTNEIAGAGLDVYEKEPLPENNKLRFLPNALLTPHIGYVTAENYSIFYTQMIEDLEACVSGKPIRVIEK